MAHAALDLGTKAPQSAAYDMPLDKIDVSDPAIFQNNTLWPYFERLRNEDPVHHCADSMFGPYWSVTKYKDIMSVDTNHQVYSSESGLGGITIRDAREDFRLPMFIAMDPPKHDAQRKVVSPIVAPENLAKLEVTIRERMQSILDSLPRNETFDWVDRVSIELTTQMLATLFDFPFEDRRKLTRWSDVATAVPGAGIIDTQEQREQELWECADYFARLWNERINAEPGSDLISMMAHGESTRNMPRNEFLGNLILLIVGGNDTTRNSITGGLLALNENPQEILKLKSNPGLIPNMVSEIIRWQTPLAHMRRTAIADAELGGKTHQEGRKGRDVVRLGQPRRRSDPERQRIHHRPPARAPASVVRLRHPSLRRQSPRRTATQNRLGRIAEARHDPRSHGRARAHLLQLRQRLRNAARADRRVDSAIKQT